VAPAAVDELKAAVLPADLAKYGKLIRESNIRAE
jgi:hypothetical protein